MRPGSKPSSSQTCSADGSTIPEGVSRAKRQRETPSGIVEPSAEDRKSTRLNSSHLGISYAVFCLKKKKTNIKTTQAIPQTNISISQPANIKNLQRDVRYID